MLRTYFQQNEDWFSNSDHPFSRLGMDSEIAELRTISKVTRLRKQIECREEGAWMVVKDVPDESTPSGSRKVTSYGRTRRSVVRSISTNSNFGPGFHNNHSDEPFVQHPGDESDVKDAKPNSVEITEVFDEPLRGNMVDIDKPLNSEKHSKKKTSVVTLGEGNLVLIDPEKESNFHVTGINKGKVADVVSTLEKSSEKKPKKVGFCKTEVHFAPDSGKINIVETDEKPPPTQVYRRKKRPRGTRKGSSCLPKHYFGDEVPDFGDDSNHSNESDKEEPRPPPAFPPRLEAIPQVKQIFPAFEKTIKSESKDVKYRHSSPEKFDTDLNIEKLQFDEKEFFRKLKQPTFRERFLKENDSPVDKGNSLSCTSSGQDDARRHIKHESQVSNLRAIKTVNGLISRHNTFAKDKFLNVPSNSVKEITVEHVEPEVPELRYTELFKASAKEESDEDIEEASQDIRTQNETFTSLKNQELEQTKYGYLNKPKIFVEEKDDYHPTSRVPIDQDIKTDVTFLGNMSPKLQSLIQKSVEHEFQLRQKQILQKRTLERKTSAKESNKIKSSVNIRLPSKDMQRQEKAVTLETTKQKPDKTATHASLNGEPSSKHEFQIKREEITNNMFSEPPYDSKKDIEIKEMPYLLNEEPIPAPRDKTKPKPLNNVPPKPKPRTVISPDRPKTAKVSPRQSVGRQSIKSDASSLSRRVKSKENLVRGKDTERSHSRSIQNREEIKPKKVASMKIEGDLQRTTKTNVHVQSRKVVRGEPLRSFEKVSNGWIGVVPAQKKEEREAPKITVMTKTYANKALVQQSSQHSSEMSGGEMDEMTASYTEISEGEGGSVETRPTQLELLTRLDGTVATEQGASGPMVTFVADDLETKLRLASPRGILAALESEACALAASVDSLTESLADALHGISAMTVDCLETYTSVVTKTSDAIDANIKAMYQLMAKSEELSKAMAPIYRLSAHIKNIKHLLDLIEASPS